MNKTYKYTLTAHEKKEISFDTGVARLAIANGDGVDGSTTVVMSEITKQHSGDLVSLIDGADAPFADFIVNIEAVQSGSDNPSPTNVRPISGWTGANILRANENLFSMDGDVLEVDASPTDIIDLSNKSLVKGIASNGYLRKNNASYSKNGNIYTISSINSSYGIGFVCPIVGNKSYYISCNASSNIRLRAIFYSNKFISSTGDITSGQTVSAPVNADYLVLMARTLNDNQDIKNIQVGVSSTEYNSVSIKSIFNIDWQSTAGTVYGGQIKPLTGELIVTYDYIASYNGETINEPWISSMDVYSEGATPTTGAQVVYPLTTPVTYQLTPTEIRSLLGVNNVWADCGPVDVRYFVQSTQPMIDYIDDKTIAYFDAVEDNLTYDISLVGATSTDIKNYLLANKNANIVIRVKRYSTVLLYYLREYSPNYFAEFATHAVIFDAEGTKSMRINYLRLNLTQETTDFTDDYIILPTT